MSTPSLRIVDLPALSIRAALAPKSIDLDARTVELIFTTGAPVTRYDWLSDTRYIERLSMDPAHVRLSRLNTGAPLLDSHSGYRLSHVLGVVEDDSASMSGKRGVATVRFSKRADVEPFWQDVKDRILQKVSVGYLVHKFEETPAKGENKLPTRLAIDWEPFEVSLVPMPADAGAQTRDGKTAAQTYPCEIVTRQLADASALTLALADADRRRNLQWSALNAPPSSATR